ncbi:hypothetical protein GLAREA_12826 [Glarea lozoyensis ATCC 20868]|uniref:Uncharacterized protein n=1 Tax=Glarea lozoyensis (strain ATCC 20868 / MF5171) TaxID=1116229 RepID=S3DUJ9_GLAL2|nr:uncharacterized protein GLAREA_12826 [Glarea lozoyensis ATCC 20868]EPE30103.1 hypothetical protein GLAREA_12826 [Glarea lozoyensis ATCC 20868]
MSLSTLPPEILSEIAKLLEDRDRNTWALVDKFSYHVLLAMRYCTITIDAYNAWDFITYAQSCSLEYCRKLNVHCITHCGPTTLTQSLLAASKFADGQITHLSWALERGSLSNEIETSDLFVKQSELRVLKLSPWPDDQPYPTSIISLTQLRELEFSIFTSRTQKLVNGELIRDVLRNNPTLEILRFVRPTEGHNPRGIRGEEWRELLTCSETEGHVQHPIGVREFVLRHCSAQDGYESFPWEVVGFGNLEILSFEQTIDVAADLGYLATITPENWGLERLEIGLWNHCMRHAPEQVSAIERFLMHGNFCGLRHLRVELPGGRRLLSAASISQHERLETLAISATDDDGWLLAFSPAEIHEIVTACQSLHTLKCVLPALSNAEFYENLAKSTSIKQLQVIGLQSPRTKTPAWSWPRDVSHFDPVPRGMMEDVSREIFGLCGRLEVLGLHVSEHYCENWEAEMRYYRYNSPAN